MHPPSLLADWPAAGGSRDGSDEAEAGRHGFDTAGVRGRGQERVEEVALQRMQSSVVHDRRKMFELFTLLKVGQHATVALPVEGRETRRTGPFLVILNRFLCSSFFMCSDLIANIFTMAYIL
jgi:hypothetical protein